MLAHVSPVVRPLLATVILIVPFSPAPPVEEMPGGAAANTPPAPGRPNSRIAPVGLTAPEFTAAMAASALVELELSGSQAVSTPTCVVPAPSPLGVQLLSMSPGWTIVSPVVAWALRASPWLQLSRRSEERRVGKECRSRWSPHRQGGK